MVRAPFGQRDFGAQTVHALRILSAGLSFFRRSPAPNWAVLAATPICSEVRGCIIREPDNTDFRLRCSFRSGIKTRPPQRARQSGLHFQRRRCFPARASSFLYPGNFQRTLSPEYPCRQGRKFRRCVDDGVSQLVVLKNIRNAFHGGACYFL